ncbi:hypothetical protein [Deinococcus wulumuqiensis]|uniref:Uncharacterized protein n=1 Tax=Deinococcus wulumuqiensis TaxID=980427 RepID=A0A345IHE7_9DEIO|nr:hypothetical protein [Deinococcus wulumuqiensis]AXG99119.1 hypothetical protein DVJ83_08030 [Deinococcus wulumuqiensis]QII20835.1 hypothetical protein G6R31_08755 [Deinococcus wulumuqiensis R12]GGI80550.1 hypothetical protein GCM10010914_13500 [Deinococcus wulumuqiensis]GGP29333.1 hypothetical protein GCM10008021_09840 [Deinococcus wulumuqiensis]
MNYAATLAVLVILAFCFPITVRLGVALGIPEALGASVLGAALVFGITAYLVRWQVGRHSLRLSRLTEARAQVAADPDDPRAYFVQGEHLGRMLLALGRRREAAEVIDRYSRLGGARESEIVALREALSQAERRQRRAQREQA